MNVNVIQITHVDLVHPRDYPIFEEIYVVHLDMHGFSIAFEEIMQTHKPVMFLNLLGTLEDHDLSSRLYDRFALYEAPDVIYASFVPQTPGGFVEAVDAINVEMAFERL